MELKPSNLHHIRDYLWIKLTVRDKRDKLFIYNTLPFLIDQLIKDNLIKCFELRLNKDQAKIFLFLMVDDCLIDQVFFKINRTLNRTADAKEIHILTEFTESNLDEFSYSIREAREKKSGEQINDIEIALAQILSDAMVEVLTDEVIDDDLLTTFGFYLLIGCYINIDQDICLSVAKSVYDNCINQSTTPTMENDQLFHRVKCHALRQILDASYKHVILADDEDLKWLKKFTKSFLKLTSAFKSQKQVEQLFLLLSQKVHQQLGFDTLTLNLLNFFVYNTLSKREKNIQAVDNSSSSLGCTSQLFDHDVRKIPLLTYYSPSYDSMFNDFFYPSFQKCLSTHFELVILNGKQLCNAVYKQDCWNQQVKEKIVFVNDFLKTTESEYVVFSDVDIVFFNNIYESLLLAIEDFDIIFQNDSVNGSLDNLCSGFYFCKVNEITKDFFNYLIENYNPDFSDQPNLNAALLQFKEIKYGSLPKQFYNFSHSTGTTWFYGNKIPFPNYRIAMYHANYTVGTVNKTFLLQTFIEWDNMC